MAQDVNVKINVNTSDAQKQSNDLKNRMRELKAELDNLAYAGKENTDEFKKLQQEYANLVDLSGDLSQKARVLSDDYYKQTAAMEGLSVGLNIFSGLTQAAALCGVENEDLQETLVKLQAAQNLANTAMNISKALNKDTALMTALNTIKTKLLTTATNEQTTAQLALNAAKLGAIGIIVGLAAAVGTLIYKYASAKSEVAKFNEELNKSAAEAVAPTVMKVNELSEAWTSLGDNLEEKEKFIKDNQEEFDKLGVSINDVADAENLLVDNTEAFLEAQTLRAKAAAARGKIEELVKEQLEDELEYERIFVDKQTTIWEDLATSFNPYVSEDTFKELHKQNQDRLDAEIKKINEKADALDKAAVAKEKEAGITVKTSEDDKKEDKGDKKDSEAERAWKEKKRKKEEEEKAELDAFNKFVESRTQARYNEEKRLNDETYEGKLKNFELEKNEIEENYKKSLEYAKKQYGEESEQYKKLTELKKDELDKLDAKKVELEKAEKKRKDDQEKEDADEKKAADEKKERDSIDAGFRIAKAESDARLLGLKEGSIEYNDELRTQYQIEYDMAMEELKRKLDDGLILQKEYDAQVLLLASKRNKKEKEINDNTLEYEITTYANAVQQRLDIAQKFTDAFSNLINAQMENELAQVGDNEEKQNEIRKRYSKKKFLTQIASIGISTAQAIAGAWASVASLAFPYNVVAGGVLTAMLAGVGVAQTKTAKTEMDNALKAEKGAFIRGKSHAQGGELWELEGGEAVLNKKAMAIPAFKQLASAMNESTGGVSFGNTVSIGSSSSKPIISAGVSDETVQKIVSDTVAGIAEIPVVVTEHRITEAQRRVEIINSQASF